MKAVLLTHRYREVVVQLMTIVAGVLIALFFDGLVEWNQNRQLANEAKTMIRREMADNQRELDELIAEYDTRQGHVQNALRLANELLRTGKSEINQFNVGRSFAELNAASWQTAERTGALRYLDYDEVRRFATVYEMQGVFTTLQRRFIDRFAAIGAVVAEGSPHDAAPEDLRAFRQQLVALHGDLRAEAELAKTLRGMYVAELKR